MQRYITKLITMLIPLISIISAQPTFPDAPDQAPYWRTWTSCCCRRSYGIEKIP
jgi:hypothetical protein